MKNYIAEGKAVYNDSKDTIKYFKAVDDYQARNYIINHFDCSLEWHFEEEKV
jgi:hypothetical protein